MSKDPPHGIPDFLKNIICGQVTAAYKPLLDTKPNRMDQIRKRNNAFCINFKQKIDEMKGRLNGEDVSEDENIIISLEQMFEVKAAGKVQTPTKSSPLAEESPVEPEVQDRQEESVIVKGAKIPNLTNDEEMPVLKPEASSSADVTRSESFAERMESIDEDVSNSSNHSIVPQHAPVLSKEATPSRANGVNAPMDCKTVSSESSAIDQDDDQLGERPMIEGEEEGMGKRSDRLDSLSMKPSGSGSPSEKNKNFG